MSCDQLDRRTVVLAAVPSAAPAGRLGLLANEELKRAIMSEAAAALK
jgi:hypothetical protein